MAKIFNIESNTSLVERIERLTLESKALWGKMNVSQMLLHAQKPLDVVEGTLILKRGILQLPILKGKSNY